MASLESKVGTIKGMMQGKFKERKEKLCSEAETDHYKTLLKRPKQRANNNNIEPGGHGTKFALHYGTVHEYGVKEGERNSPSRSTQS